MNNVRVLATMAAFIAAAVLGVFGTSAAQTTAAPIPVSVPSVAGSLGGTATDANGGPLAGVVVNATGPGRGAATTDAGGNYTITGLPPGLYTVTATKAGYNATSLTDVAVVAGAPLSLNVSLAAATLSSLREIGRVSVNVGRSVFNTSPASVSVVTSQTFIDQGQPQVARILDQTPGVVSSLPGGVNNASPGAITFPNIRGALSFETAALIDGHPLSVGQYGDYVTTFLNSFALQSVELIKGPGAASPTISRAIGGTVNFRTLDPTTKPHGTFTVGVDSFGGVFSNVGYSNTVGRLGFLFDYAVNGTPGPLNNRPYNMALDQGTYYVTDSHGNRVDLPAGTVNATFGSNDPRGQYNTRGESSTSLIFCCEHISTTFTNKNELVKLRYNLSGSTTATATFLGSQTYADQNGNNGNRTTTLFTPGAAYAGAIPAGTQFIVDPDNFGLPAYEINNEPIFQAEIRTTFHQDNILARYYTASISRLQYGSNHDPNASSSFAARIYGGGGADGTPAFNGLDPYGKPYTITVPGPNDPVLLASQDPNNPNPPNGANLGGGNNYYDSAEEDRLTGSSFEYDHFLSQSGNVVSFAYDTNHARTHSYSFGFPLDSVPAGSTQDTTTFLLRGLFTVGKLNITASNYLTDFRSHYGVYDTTGVTKLFFQDQDLWHYDGRVGFVYRPNPDVSARFSFGSAVAPPYLGALVANTFAPRKCGGFFTPCPNGQPIVAVSQAANPGLQAETSFGYDVGGDIRLPDRLTVLTADVYLTNLHNQFVRGTSLNGTASVDVGGGTMKTLPLYTTAYANVSNARYAGLEFGVRRDPTAGFGYLAQGALLRGYPYNLSPGFFAGSGGANTTNLGVVPNINFGSHNTVSNQAIPYSQGYAEVHYRTPRGIFLAFGETYYGSNNSLNVPAFVAANATARVPLGKVGALQISVDNLFNILSDPITNEYVGNREPFVNGQYYASNANVMGPRNVRIEFTKTFGSR